MVSLNILVNLKGYYKIYMRFWGDIILIIMTNETKETIRTLLKKKMANILGIADDTLDRLSKADGSFPDPLDRAMSESISSIELRKRDRERKLLQKITDALNRLDNNSYGICDLCGNEISEDRLIARPETSMCIDCKEEQEDIEKRFG